MTDTDAQTDEITGAEFREDIAQAVMSTMAAALLDPDRTGWQIEIIVHHQNRFWRNIKIATDRCDRTPALVHEGGGF